MMKREDFKIEGIPEGYRVYGVDLTPSGKPVAVIGHTSDVSSPAYADTGRRRIELPAGMIGRDNVSGRMFQTGHVRAAGEDHVAVVERRRTVQNGSVWDACGHRMATFDAGHDVEEVLAGEDVILLFYGDEGQTSGPGISREGLAVFATDGTLLWGHGSQFGDERLTVWFHSAAWVGPNEVAVFADVKDVCAFVRLNVRERRQTVWYPPDPISRPVAVTTLGDRVIAYGTVVPWALPGNEKTAPDQIIEWTPGEESWRVVGSWPFDVTSTYPPLRGLPGGRFIAVQPDGYTILSFD